MIHIPYQTVNGEGDTRKPPQMHEIRTGDIKVIGQKQLQDPAVLKL